ncbi:Serine/threonine-protein phosphatase 1 regulatory subunit 10 [Paragonimus heterotremus]|uniref:Serine/threonine-protein phosphatase 1 regulatory subunit 10 n=1 Tax=Paragonimus heterotremus TaxID=100268 RepID=A0A8J4TCC7_9TREM|nr:Serine/threonine-protein phosphatase 1 regulatory subunit 10 [Paragonimus heterotremus]
MSSSLRLFCSRTCVNYVQLVYNQETNHTVLFGCFSSQAITEPDRLLNEYHAHLSDNGGIMLNSIPHLIDLMRSTNGKLVPKCIALCIISSTIPDIQSKLCKEGAWDILLKWLQEALKEDNYPFLIELLKVYLMLPVRLEQLTQNVCPKLINSLTKRCEHDSRLLLFPRLFSHSAVKSLAFEIVKKWKGVISSDSRRLEQPDVKKKKLDSGIKSDDSHSSEDLKHDKKRLRTVKMPPTVMRTAGVEDVSQTYPKSRLEVLSKKSKLDVDIKPTSELPIESFHQKITVTPSEPRKNIAEMHESPDFINALTTTCPVVRKKRKLSVSKIETQVSCETQQVAPSAPLNTSELTDETTKSDSQSPSSSPLGMGTKKSSLISLSSSFSVECKPKKRVSWAEEDKLQSFFYFELDESERVNVNRVSLDEIRKKDLSLERQMFRRNAEESIVSSQKWYTPLPLERLFLIEPGYKSTERQVQTERERYVLQAIYFSRENIPPTPEEPDPEVIEQSLPLDIPLEDLTISDSNGAVDSNFSSEKLLVLKDSMGNTQMSLNPEVADLVKSLAANLSGVSPTVTVPSTGNHDTEGHSAYSERSQMLTTTTSELPVGELSHSESNTVPTQMLQRELWEVLEENYPDINVRELSAERIRSLLEPLRDQLVTRGIFQLPHMDSFPLSMVPPFHASPPRPHGNYGPQPGYPGPPHLPPGPLGEFILTHPPTVRSAPPGGGFRPAPPSVMNRPPHYRPSGPPPPPFVRVPGPIRGGPHAPPHRSSPYMRGTSVARGGRGGQLCKFFQQGACRNGASCGFVHAKR